MGKLGCGDGPSTASVQQENFKVTIPENQCPLCQGPAVLKHPAMHVLAECPRCGTFNFSLGWWQQIEPIPPEVFPYLSIAIRQATEEDRQVTLRPGKWQELVESQRSVRVAERLDRILRLIARKAELPGASVAITNDQDYFLYSARNLQELWTYLDFLEARGLIKTRKTQQTTLCSVTVPGWQVIEPMLTPGGIEGRCFVAMSFDPRLDDAYTVGIEPAIRDCGFEPVCMKTIQTNEGITDRILAEVRLAQFVVADFTGQRHGVYFEAGFAKGLGRQVIWSCRSDDVDNLHFDTKHLGHVVWENPSDLRLKLASSIRTNILPKR